MGCTYPYKNSSDVGVGVRLVELLSGLGCSWGQGIGFYTDVCGAISVTSGWCFLPGGVPITLAKCPIHRDTPPNTIETDMIPPHNKVGYHHNDNWVMTPLAVNTHQSLPAYHSHTVPGNLVNGSIDPHHTNTDLLSGSLIASRILLFITGSHRLSHRVQNQDIQNNTICPDNMYKQCLHKQQI